MIDKFGVEKINL